MEEVSVRNEERMCPPQKQRGVCTVKNMTWTKEESLDKGNGQLGLRKQFKVQCAFGGFQNPTHFVARSSCSSLTQNHFLHVLSSKHPDLRKPSQKFASLVEEMSNRDG